jgi:signal transduction histidine kinase
MIKKFKAKTEHLPLRVRLTLWFSMVFAAALLCLGFACLWMVHRAVNDLEDNELQQRVRSVHRFIAARPEHESPADLRDAITAAYDVSHGNKWLQIIDENGNWLYRSPHVAGVYPTLVSPQQATEDGTYFNYVAESIHVRALIKPISVHGVRYTVQTGLTLSKTLAVLSNFRVQLFLLTALGLLLSSLAGYFMSRKALTPIAAIANEAQRINDKNLNLRLPDLQTHDELAALSNTLNQMLTRIEAGYQSVRSFTANAAHELRSPVALLRAETEVALAFPRDATYYRETCERVLNNSVQMTRLIDQLLSLARADAGVEVLRFEPVNLPDLLDEVANEWTERFAEANIQFKCNFGPQELWVEADYFALKRLMNILLENAWRYTPSDKSVTLTCSEQAQSSDQITAEISVADTGIGISPDNQLRIFQRFCRIAQPLHGDFTGNGLGLVLAQWIAEQHGSTITLQSSYGQGSRFYLSLNSISTSQKLTGHSSFRLSIDAKESTHSSNVA